MKRFLATISIAITFSVMFSVPSFADWVMVSLTDDGQTTYVDLESIRKHDRHVYWWELWDYPKPDKFGDLSAKSYVKGDCKLFRLKSLNWSYHREPMGRGTGGVDNNADKEWHYPSSNSSSENILKFVCAY